MYKGCSFRNKPCTLKCKEVTVINWSPESKKIILLKNLKIKTQTVFITQNYGLLLPC